jgi:hypothetical protein
MAPAAESLIQAAAAGYLRPAIEGSINVTLRQSNHSDRGISHTIKFSDTFAHSSVSVFGRVKDISHLLVEAVVTQRPTSRRYACEFPALAGNADAALYFLQLIDGTHRPYASSVNP